LCDVSYPIHHKQNKITEVITDRGGRIDDLVGGAAIIPAPAMHGTEMQEPQHQHFETTTIKKSLLDSYYSSILNSTTTNQQRYQQQVLIL